MHPNEIPITPKNAAALKAEAVYMDTHYGKGYEGALFEQLRRQIMDGATERAVEREIRP
jgi:hypothetical protein